MISIVRGPLAPGILEKVIKNYGLSPKPGVQIIRNYPKGKFFSLYPKLCWETITDLFKEIRFYGEMFINAINGFLTMILLVVFFPVIVIWRAFPFILVIKTKKALTPCERIVKADASNIRVSS